MPALLGRGAVIGFGVESTHGTAVSRTNWLRVISLAGHIAQVERTARTHSDGPADATGGMPVAMDEGPIRTTGMTFETPASYADSTVYLLYAAMGATAEAGSGPYTHTLTLAGTLPSLTWEVGVGADSAGTDRGLVVNGCKCSELDLTWTPDGKPAVLRTVWIARKDAGDAAVGSPTLPLVSTPSIAWHGGDIGWNSLTIAKENIRSVKLSIRNGFGEERIGFGDRYAQEPYLDSRRAITYEVTFEHLAAETSLYDDWIGGDSSNLTQTFSDGTNSFAITLHNAQITSFTSSTAVTGVVTRTLIWTAKAAVSPGNKGLAIVVTNGYATSLDPGTS